MSKNLELACTDLGEYLVDLAKKYELDYGQVLAIMDGYVRATRKKLTEFELAYIKRVGK